MSDMKTTYPNDGDVWVCTDCYFAHHYGAHDEVRPATDAEEANYLNGWKQYDPAGIRETDHGLEVVEWFSGESDIPCDREPLCKLDDVDLSDNTCSDHDADETRDDDYELIEIPCTHCGQTGYENGIQEFSWSSCGGCGSNLGGSRYRLHWTERKQR